MTQALDVGASGVVSTDRATRDAAKDKAKEKYLNLGITLMVMGGLAMIYLAARLYQQAFAWSAGMDSTNPLFDKYWMTLLYTELTVLAVAAAVVWSYLWLTRDRHLDLIEPRTELKRYFTLVAWILCYVFAVYFTASFFGEEDASWHQVVVRDTSFTPSHIVLFYLTIPLYIILGVGSYLYASTRLPQFARAISVPFVIGVTGPFLILPNLGFNEWGHAFWLMEELFIAPLHWGFVVLGWSALALGGLLMQVSPNIVELLKKIYGTEETEHLADTI
ncbi:MAG: bacterial ammonia monooxygenase, subunit AmoC [Xanthobacteraceae bacterium]